MRVNLQDILKDVPPHLRRSIDPNVIAAFIDGDFEPKTLQEAQAHARQIMADYDDIEALHIYARTRYGHLILVEFSGDGGIDVLHNFGPVLNVVNVTASKGIKSHFEALKNDLLELAKFLQQIGLEGGDTYNSVEDLAWLAVDLSYDLKPYTSAMGRTTDHGLLRKRFLDLIALRRDVGGLHDSLRGDLDALPEEVWARLVGRRNENDIFALLQKLQRNPIFNTITQDPETGLIVWL